MRLEAWRIRKKFGRWRVYQPGASVYSEYSATTHAGAIALVAVWQERRV